MKVSGQFLLPLPPSLVLLLFMQTKYLLITGPFNVFFNEGSQFNMDIRKTEKTFLLSFSSTHVGMRCRAISK